MDVNTTQSRDSKWTGLNVQAAKVCILYYSRPFNLHLDFWKSRSWEINVCFNPKKKFRSCKPDFFFSVHLRFFFSLSPGFFQVYGINLQKIQVTNWKKIRCTEKKFRCAGPEIFLRSETEIKAQNKWLSMSLIDVIKVIIL